MEFKVKFKFFAQDLGSFWLMSYSSSGKDRQGDKP